MSSWLREHQVIMAAATLGAGALTLTAAVIGGGEGAGATDAPLAAADWAGEAVSDASSDDALATLEAAPSEPVAPDVPALLARMEEGNRFEQVAAIRDVFALGDDEATVAAIRRYVETRPYVDVALEKPRKGADRNLTRAYDQGAGKLRLRDLTIDDDYQVSVLTPGNFRYAGIVVSGGFVASWNTCDLRLDAYEAGELRGEYRCGQDAIDAALLIE